MTIPQARIPCIDLHCHSRASDGALSPADVVQRAAQRGVTHLALTDHDTVAGLPEARKESERQGLTLVNGVELSCAWGSQTIHIVGLDFDEHAPPLVQAMAEQLENRWRRARAIDERLARLKIPDLLARATAAADGEVPGRPHFARVLIEAGAAGNNQQAFKRYLGAGKSGDVRAFWPSLETVVSWVLEAGGIAVIAHPRKYKMTATRLRSLVSDFQRSGGQGIEVSVSGQSSGDLGFVSELCRRQGLWASQGSDFHSPGAFWAELGSVARLPEDLETVWQHFRQPVSICGGSVGAPPGSGT